VAAGIVALDLHTFQVVTHTSLLFTPTSAAALRLGLNAFTSSRTKMKKLIISHDDDIDPLDALDYVAYLVRKGRVSGNGKQYCYMTVAGEIVVVSGVTKAGSDTIRIYKENQLEQHHD